MLCNSLRDRLRPCLRDYDRLQSFAVILIYIQIGCALIGSLGALYNGVLLINLAIALFALVAIESSSQSLGRTYAVLLFSAIFLDVFWFILFAYDTWFLPFFRFIMNISSEQYGPLFTFSVKLTLAMQIIGFSVRLSSSLLWIQIYRLGISYMETSVPREADYDLRNSFLSPATPVVVRQPSGSDDMIGGSIYDPTYYSSLFEDGQDSKCLSGDCHYVQAMWSSFLQGFSVSFAGLWSVKETIEEFLFHSLFRDKGGFYGLPGCVLLFETFGVRGTIESFRVGKGCMISHFGNGDNGSTSGPDVSRSKLSRHFQVADHQLQPTHPSALIASPTSSLEEVQGAPPLLTPASRGGKLM
uniref:Uncharacterized protein n=1 Tax=Cucumis melo TaxID=3656 RepID=A0A9I9EAH2_CUCME